MEGENMLVLHVLLLMTFIQAIQGQAITPLLVYVEEGGQVSLECTTTAPDGTFDFSWSEVSSGTIIFTGGRKQPAPGSFDNFNVDEDIANKRSTLIISNILKNDDADDYRCTVTQQPVQDDATVIVEVGSVDETPALSSSSDYSEYIATCNAVGSSPEETITWILNGVTQTNGIVETDPQISDDSLFDKRSVFTFPATIENYKARLDCNISGHQVDKLNRQETILVDIHNPPEAEGITIGLNSDGTTLTVSCNIKPGVDEAIPPMDSFYIYSNGTLVTKPVSANSVTVSEPDHDTEYMCVGGNYLGNTTATETFYPGRTTTPPTPTAPDTTEPVVGPSSPPGTAGGLSVGAIAGIAVGAIIAIAVIIVLIVVFVVKPDCIGGSGPPKTTSHKHSTSAVGSSNGNEKEKIKPEAAPRGHSSIKHTTDNPDQAEYAMVDRRQGGRGDTTDARGNGAGQNEQPGMHYADLDLTSGAGHSDRVVPKNEDGVVVYSSILV